MDRNYLPRPLRAPVDPPFKILRQFNCEEGRREAGQKHRLAPSWMHWFAGDGLVDQLARALAAQPAIDMKEFAESLEFFHRARHSIRVPRVADLCCGHGFTGLLVALFERVVEEVWLVDRARPPAHDAIFEAVCRVGPWVREKVRFVETPLKHLTLPAGTGVIGVHACGAATDACIDQAIAARGPVVVMPCCYGRAVYAGPRAIHKAFGKIFAADVQRTYRLEAAGYEVLWSAIPRCVTPLNRIILGRPKS